MPSAAPATIDELQNQRHFTLTDISSRNAPDNQHFSARMLRRSDFLKPSSRVRDRVTNEQELARRILGWVAERNPSG